MCDGDGAHTVAPVPRYLVERSFPDGLDIPAGSEGRALLSGIIACNADRNVVWVHSFVGEEARRTYCIYDAPSPEAIRLSARASGLPIDRIVEVAVLDPYAFHAR